MKTRVPKNLNRIYFEKDVLVIAHGNEDIEKIELRKDAAPIDRNADAHTVRFYQYMEAMGRSGCVMYGHQNDLWHKAGAKNLSFSDTKDLTGEYPAVLGMDVLAFVENEFCAERYNAEYAGREGFLEEQIDIEQLGSAYANVVAAAKLVNYAMAHGAVVSLSAHMPNFTQVEKRDGTDWEQTYAKYDFSHYTPNVVEGNVVTKIMPYGEYNEVYLAYLDMIADFAKLVDGPMMFRPFHENTGSWFWWGEAHCTPEEFKALFQYTVEYLRDVKGIHNFLYVYSPGSEPKSVEEFALRYPGDDYIDMVGVDMYDRMADHDCDEVFFQDMRHQLDVLEKFSTAHDKLMAVTETGLAVDKPDEGDTMTAVHRTGNRNPKWYMDVLETVSQSRASYFLLWANFSKTGSFYSPYVDCIDEQGNREGHELVNEFIHYYNDRRSVFSKMQADATKEFYN